MKLWFKYFLLGGLSCWGPEIVVAAVGAAMGRLWELPNLILPLTACLAYLLLLRSEKRLQSDPFYCRFHADRHLVSRPDADFYRSKFKGGGFRIGGNGLWYFLLFSLMPWYVVDIATYDVSLGALLVVTIFLAVEHSRHERKHWILPFRRYTQMVLGDKS